MATWNANGTFEFRGDVDWFRIRLTAGTSYYTTLLNNISLNIYRPDGSLLPSFFNNTNSFVAPVTGDYFVSLQSLASAGAYNFQIFDFVDAIPGSAATSQVVTVGATLNLPATAVTSVAQRDWIAFDAVAGTNYVVTTSATGSNMRIVDASGTPVGVNGLNGQTAQSGYFAATTTARYYVELLPSNNAYTLSLATVGDDRAQTISTTGTLAVGSPASGVFEARGDADWYAITLAADTSYRFTLSGAALSGESWRVRFADSTDTILGTGPNINSALFSSRAAGTYYVSAELFAGASGGATTSRAYTLTATTVASDVVDTINTASALTIGGTINSSWQALNDADWFRVTLTAGQSYSFSQTGSGNGFPGPTIALYDSTGALIKRGGAVMDGTLLTATAATSGTYYLGLATGTYLGAYAVTTSTYTDDFADNATTTATLAVGGSSTSVNETLNDVDWFAITLTANTQYQFSGDFLGVFNAAGTELTNVNVSGTQVFSPTTTGTYYIAASGFNTNVTTISAAIVADDLAASTSTTGVIRLLNNGTNSAETLNDTATDDEIRASGGNDTIISGLGGSDFYDGGAGFDTLSYAAFSAAIDVRLNQNRSLVAGVQRDIIIGIENLIGTGFDDNLVGNGAVNRIEGGNGNDVIDGQANTDTMIGGLGDDTYVVDNVGDIVTELDGEGNDTVRTALTNFGLPANVESLIYTGTAAVTLTGTAANNTLTGGSGNDTLDLSQGGNDTANGGDGNDGFIFGATFDANDSVDGGAGTNDQIGLLGNYAGGLTLGASSTRNVEVLAVLPGTGFSYNITTVNANVAAGQQLVIFGGNLGATNNLTFDGSVETDGTFRVYGGLGVENIILGAGDDGVYFGPGKFGAGDVIEGRDGNNDQVALDGNYTVTITRAQFNTVETLVLLRGIDGDLGTYNITLNEQLDISGGIFTVFGLAVETGFTFNAGTVNIQFSLQVIGGSGNDIITTSDGADRLFGGGGADVLYGARNPTILFDQRPSGDTYVYDAVSQSTGPTYDRIIGFSSDVDTFDFNFAVTGVGATVGSGALSTATFDANLAAAIGAGQLAANHAVLFQANAGDLAGKSFLIVDANGVAGYQAGADYVIQLELLEGTLATNNFI